jgi:tetratricopeptide (TPR) repeat protein
MRTADLLGSAEIGRGHYEGARAWYTEAERLARDLGDDGQRATTAHNLGVLLRQQALALPEEAKAERRRLLGEAAASVTKSLAIQRQRNNDVGTADSLSQLGVINRHLGALDEAERHARQALATRERLGLPDVYKDYWTLEAIATARGHTAEAATWRAKKEAKIAELRRLAQGSGPPRLPLGTRDAFLTLCQSLHAARTAHQPLPPDAAEAIAALVTQPDPSAQPAASSRPSPPAKIPRSPTASRRSSPKSSPPSSKRSAAVGTAEVSIRLDRATQRRPWPSAWR